MIKKITSFFVAIFGWPKFWQFSVLIGIIFICSASFFIGRIEAVDSAIYQKNNEILVKLKNNNDIYCLNLADTENYEQMLEELSNDVKVDYAEPNYIYQAALIPSDSYYANQWYLQKIKAPQAWDIIRESENIVIAIIDTGVQIDHPDLADNIWVNKKEIAGNGIDDDQNGFIDDINGWDFVNNEANPEPKFKEGYTEDGIWHGTIVAGIAAAAGNNATGIAGVTWRSRIMPLKVLDDEGAGDTRNVMRAIDYAIANGADIINFSFVGPGFSRSLEATIRRAYEANIIIVAAAGNELSEGEGYFLDETPIYPACHDGGAGENMVIGVAATDALDQKALFSSFGYKCVDLAAPGVSFFSTVVKAPDFNKEGMNFDNYYDGYWSGTSLATAIVSGAAALTAAVNPSLSRNKVVSLIIDQTDNINRLNPDYFGQLGRGRLNVYKSVLQAKSLITANNFHIIVVPQSNNASIIKKINNKGEVFSEWLAYDKNFNGGVNVATGDIDGNGQAEIITGAGFGGGPHVRIFNGQGGLVSQFFAYDKSFRGGVNVAAGDVDGDGQDEIITGAGFSGGPQVRIFKADGRVLGQFFAYDTGFRGGVNVAAGDVDGDGQDEIITGAGFSGGPQVRIFKADGRVLGQFFAYDTGFRGGVNVAAGDIVGGARNSGFEIITAPGPGGGPHIRIFDDQGQIVSQFFAYDKKFKGGVNITAGDLDQDGLAEIITGAGPGGSPHLRSFNKDGKLIDSLFVFSASFSGGIKLSTYYYY